MKQRGRTLFCVWCVFLACVSAGGGGAGPGQDTAPASEDVLLEGAANVTGQTTSRDVDKGSQRSQIASLDKAVTHNSNLSVQVPHKTVPGHHVLGKEGQSVSESSEQSLTHSTTKATPPPSPPDVLLHRAIGVVGQGTSHHLDNAVQLNDSVPDDPKAVLPSSAVSVPIPSKNAFSKDALGDENQGVTKSSPHLWQPSTAGLPYARTTGADAEHRKRQDVGRATKGNTEGLCDNYHDMTFLEEEYSMLNNTHKITAIPHHSTVSVSVTDIDEAARFLIFQAHSQNNYLILSNQKLPARDCYTNGTDPGLVMWPAVDDLNGCNRKLKSCQVFITNCHNKNITVLFMVNNYTSIDPIPGAYKTPCVPIPFLSLDPNVLTTEVSYQAASMFDWEAVEVVGALRYEIYLTYMYERDLSESKYWDTLIGTSTLQGLKENGKLVDVKENNDTAELLNVWLVSYSGVGAVVTVVVSYNGSHGTLYSSGVSYGCNFIDAEEYRCTKLVTTLAKLFCASLLFIGGILLFLGHRWLNFTMFISGFLFSWCMLFLMFAQDTHSTITGLGWGTLLGAVLGGALWLLGWHKFRRPFHSALLIIIMTVFFVGMIVTYFLRFAIYPKTSNLSAFVVFPVLFAIIIIAYSIIDIKRVHIFSCTLLGSYAFIVPFAFYFGSSLTYIVINVLGLLTVEHYSDTVGYPPFQVCDIILLCLWLVLFVGGMAYQLYRERATPPFHPPNLTSWKDFKRSVNFVFDKMFACLPMDPDPGGIDVEERPAWLLRVVYTSKLAWQRLTCRRGDIPESGYESFPRIRRLSQYNEENSDSQESRMAIILSRINEWKGRVQLYFRRGNERLLQEDEDEEQPKEEEEEEREEDESQLLEGTVSCCAFRNSQVVLDDAYTTNA